MFSNKWFEIRFEIIPFLYFNFNFNFNYNRKYAYAFSYSLKLKYKVWSYATFIMLEKMTRFTSFLKFPSIYPL